VLLHLPLEAVHLGSPAWILAALLTESQETYGEQEHRIHDLGRQQAREQGHRFSRVDFWLSGKGDRSRR
jgi:hypothetical protein